MACSEKQLESNRRNAQKSTGPTSAGGKAVSRQNALKHGLCAEVVAVAGEDADAIALEMAGWVAEVAPQGIVAARLAERAFAAFLRLRRCDRAEAAALAQRQANATRDWDIKRQNERRAVQVKLNAAPSTTVAMLLSTPEGCDWLIAQWERYFKKLKTYDWDLETDNGGLLNVMGIEGTNEDLLMKKVDLYWELLEDRGGLIAQGMPGNADETLMRTRFTPDFVARVLKNRERGEKARNDLIVFCQEHIEELEALREGIRPQHEYQRSLAAELALIDDSPEAARRQRYANDAERSLHRNLNAAAQAMKLQVLEEEVSVEPTPVSQAQLPPAPAQNKPSLPPADPGTLVDAIMANPALSNAERTRQLGAALEHFRVSV